MTQMCQKYDFKRGNKVEKDKERKYIALSKVFHRELNDMALRQFLKHLRQFVQSDWFLHVFISHDKDKALNVCTTHAPGWIDPLECRDLFLS